jgi:circadian clock protein KaiB
MRAKPGKSVPLVLRLYIAGNAPNSLRAIANLRAICDEHFAAAHEIEVVDLVLHPDRAFDDGVIVTPTLVRMKPGPVRRLIGSLSDTSQVVLALGTK